MAMMTLSQSRVDMTIEAGLVPDDITAEFLNENHDVAGIVTIVILTVAASAVICRLFSRAFVVERWGPDDYLALSSLLAFIPASALAIQLIMLGSTRSQAYKDLILDKEEFETIQIFDTALPTVYYTALIMCRVSVLALYCRICHLYNELLSIKFVFVFLMLGFLAQIALIVFHCWPVTVLWAPEMEEEFTCLPWHTVVAISSSISLTSDLVLFGIPVSMLRVLRMMPRAQKLQLGCILLPGIVVIGISVARLALALYWHQEDDDNFIKAFLWFLIVQIAEVAATLIALSVPGLKPLVERFTSWKDDCLSESDNKIDQSLKLSSESFHGTQSLNI